MARLIQTAERTKATGHLPALLLEQDLGVVVGTQHQQQPEFRTVLLPHQPILHVHQITAAVA